MTRTGGSLSAEAWFWRWCCRIMATAPGHGSAMRAGQSAHAGAEQSRLSVVAAPLRRPGGPAQALSPPDLPWLEGGIAHLKMYVADWGDFAARKARAGERRARRSPGGAAFHVSGPVGRSGTVASLLAHLSPRSFRPCHRAPHERRVRDKIRIGYVSGEFREQATAILMAGLI